MHLERVKYIDKYLKLFYFNKRLTSSDNTTDQLYLLFLQFDVFLSLHAVLE